ncbi:response regulator transcription factor [Skermanella pratensis]|uniref:response regulator transcription factor n=1 Tax=Skermanella pratensis TaxID=2233999 RepID=UPI0017878C10|nr:response regulator transcription factor [Skermanella pratensis]
MSLPQSVVFVVDDDPSVRESIRSLLRSVGHSVQAFDTTQAFMLGERLDVPGCLILDVRLPGSSGLELQRELAGSGISIPIVFITGHGDIPMSVAAMKAGALEFLTKPFRDQDLLDAVHRGIELDRGRREELAMLAELRERFATLTPREQEIMALVAAGLMNKQIAGELQLSEVTVKVHRAQVMRKMQARSLPDLVRFADKLGAVTAKP